MNIGEIILDLELRRKLFHLFALLLWLLPINFFPKPLTILLFLLVLFINLLTVMGLWKERLPFYYKLVYKLEREKNYSKPSIQALWANLGIFLSFLIFGKEASTVGVVVLAVGDAFAGMVGIRYGKRRIGNKSLEGAFAFFLSVFFVLFPFIGLWQAFVVALLSSVAEILPFKLDDNLTIPLIASLVYKILML
ncbi:MAG: phosphatidate cytidylyltransferase [Aquificota bacterium]|jgi:dolichol kinase|nr:phosphatidate cytidylyltransferase [Aquificaceae bacterium]MDM7267097.1 phosphatidate cytidylyltransferase [Aquificaceae bacterium]